MPNQSTELLIKIKADLGSVVADINRVAKSIEDSGSAANRSTDSYQLQTKSIGGMSSAVAGLKGQFVQLLAVYKLLEGAKAVVSTAADLQDTETRLRSLTGTAEQYAQTEEYLVKLAKDHHKEYFTLADSYTRLLAIQKAGLVTQRQGKDILEGMSNAASELGVSNADLALSMRGTIQQLGNSTVQWDEMRQATDPIPGLLQNIVKASGLTTGAMKAQAETGQYTTAMFRDNLITALDNYEGASKRTGKNIHAQYTDIQNAYTELVRVLEHPISDALTPILKGLSSSISEIANGPSLKDKIAELEALERTLQGGGRGFVAKSSNELQDSLNPKPRAGGGRGFVAKSDDRSDNEKRRDELKQEIELIQKKDEAQRIAAENQDKTEKAALKDRDAKAAATKKAEDDKEAATKKAKSAAESAAKAYASEREAVAKNIDQLNFELATLKLSDEERALQIKIRSLGAKATEKERVEIEAGVWALDKETTAQKRLNESKEQQVKDAFSYADLHREIADAARSNDQSLSGFSANLAKIQDMSKQLDLSPAQTKEMYDMLGKGFNEGFIDPAEKGIDKLSEFSVQAAHNMQTAFADFLFDPFANGTESMAANFAKTLQRMVADAASAQIFESLLGKNWGKENATGGLLSALFSGVAGAVGGAFGGGEAVSVAAGNSAAFSNTMTNFQWMPRKFHDGGIIGQGGRSINADPSIFSAATRYHSGGIPGLKPNEVPIIALNNEEVLTANDPRHRNNLKKTMAIGSNSDGIDITTHVTVTADNPSDVAKGNQLGEAANASMRQLLVTEMRDGGLIDQWFRNRR